MDTFKIELVDLKIRAFHGIHKEEQLMGSFFLVNLLVEYKEDRSKEMVLENCVDYCVLNEIVQKEMKERKPLLEEVVQLIVGQIENSIQHLTKVEIGIEKLNPPIPNFNGRSVKVNLTRHYGKDGSYI